jgi:hypothetical protein
MLRHVLLTCSLSAAAALIVAAEPPFAAAQSTAPAATATAIPANSSDFGEQAVLCGEYVPPFPFPDKDYTESNGPEFKTIYSSLTHDLNVVGSGFTETIIAHEEKDGKVQDRTYHFSYICPSPPGTVDGHPVEARTDIVAGSGYHGQAGSAALWHGGIVVRGHQGGFIKHLQAIISIKDPRATSMIGRTINESVLQSGLLVLKTMGPTKVAPDETITIKGENGTETHPCKVLEQTFDNPSLNHGITTERDYLDASTYFLVRHQGFINGKLVETEDFSKITPTTQLTKADFQ